MRVTIRMGQAIWPEVGPVVVGDCVALRLVAHVAKVETRRIRGVEVPVATPKMLEMGSRRQRHLGRRGRVILRSRIPGRMSIYEVADYLGIARQRVDAIHRRGSSHFPAPVQVRPAGPHLWDRAEIEAWAEREWWGRYSWRMRG